MNCVSPTRPLLLFPFSGNETDQSHEKQKIEIDSLVEVTQGVDISNKQLLCTAIGSSIQWLIYVSNLTSSVINDTDRGVLIKRNRVSSCVFSSTLTILNYREHSYAGSVVMCTTSIPANTGNHSANFTLPSSKNLLIVCLICVQFFFKLDYLFLLIKVRLFVLQVKLDMKWFKMDIG